MARATCRCGQTLEIPTRGVEHVVCPRCEARVRIVRKPKAGPRADGPGEYGDGFLRFSCPCGRRLKVTAADRPSHGKCPDCGAVVPVPDDLVASHAPAAESPTEELAAPDVAMLEAWARTHVGPKSTAEMPSDLRARDKGEAGLRVCPRCGKPIHLGADACRDCGIAVPKR